MSRMRKLVREAKEFKGVLPYPPPYPPPMVLVQVDREGYFPDLPDYIHVGEEAGWDKLRYNIRLTPHELCHLNAERTTARCEDVGDDNWVLVELCDGEYLSEWIEYGDLPEWAQTLAHTRRVRDRVWSEDWSCAPKSRTRRGVVTPKHGFRSRGRSRSARRGSR